MQTEIENSLLDLDQPELAKLFAATAEYAFESILITTAGSGDAGYSIVYVNPAFTAMTGYEAHEAIGKSPGMLQGPKTDVDVLERLASDLHAGRQFHGQAINYRKDGSEFILEWKIIPVIGSQGSATHLVSSAARGHVGLAAISPTLNLAGINACRPARGAESQPPVCCARLPCERSGALP